ncbi:hypothetical protein XENOCAPTIV_029242, partial [Xenoophorus captivus]
MRAGAAGIGVRRGGHVGDRREGRGETRDGAGPSPRKLGYKTLEELSKQEPSIVAITLSSNPGFRVLLAETPMRPDLIQLVCLVLSKAFTSRTERGTRQHLADIIKESKPFSSLDTEAWPDMEELGLDESQMKAFQLALTKELAIIQGPPGTGKTYVGLKIAQALLTNQELWNNGDPAPMLVVCYTNHALDQFLEEIYFRYTLGKSHLPPFPNNLQIEDSFETVKGKNTNVMMEWLGLGLTHFQQREPETAKGNDEEAVEEEDDLIEIAEEAELIQAERMIDDGWTIGPRADRDDKKKGKVDESVREVEELMLAMNLDNIDVRVQQSEDAWQMQRDQRRKMKNKIKKEIGKSSVMTEQEENNILNIWSLNLEDRWRLYRLWVTRYRIELRTKALESEQAYQNAVDRLADVKRQENLHILKKAT